MKLLTPESFINRLHNKQVAVITVEFISNQSAATVKNGVAQWLTNINTLKPDRHFLVYRRATKDTSTSFHMGNSYFDIESFVCFEGDNSLMCAIEQSTVVLKGLRHYHTTLIAFDIEGSDL